MLDTILAEALSTQTMATDDVATSSSVLHYTETEAARFLLQAQFACTNNDIRAVREQTYEGWLKSQYALPPSQTGTEWLDSRGHGNPDINTKVFNPVIGDYMAWRMMMTGSDQVRKRLALALSEMMVVSLAPIDGFWPPYVIAGYWDMLTAHVFGNFRSLIEALTLNPAMGFYLNTKGNQKEDPASGRVPDENYAREIMQLFTIGLYELNLDGSVKTDANGRPIESYTQADITQLARVFTGYDWNYSRVTYRKMDFLSYPIPSTEFARDRMVVDPGKHSMLSVTFLGLTIPANTPPETALAMALDHLFHHPNVGPFFARLMIQRLVTSNPSPAYIARVATAFNDNGQGVRGDLKAFWTAILTDKEARTMPTTALSGKVREPMIRWIQWARNFSVSSETGVWEIYDTSNGDWGLGQSPLRSPSVFNYFRPGYVPPKTKLALTGDVAPEFQIHNETTTAGYLNFLVSVLKDGYRDVKPNYDVLMPLAHDTKALLDWLNLYFSANQISPSTQSMMGAALDTTPITSASPEAQKLDRICGAILMVMACPEYIIQK